MPPVVGMLTSRWSRSTRGCRDRRQRTAGGSSRSFGSRTRASSIAPPSLALSCAAVPWAITRAGIDHDDLVSQVFGLFHVLGREQHGRAAGDQFLDEAPRRRCGARIQTRRRLVEEQDRRAGNQARTDIQTRRMPPE